MLNIQKINDVQIVTIEGSNRLNAVNAQEIKEKINTLIAPESVLIFDFKNIMHVDSTGFGTLLSFYKNSLKANCSFRICNVAQEILDLIKLMHLDSVFDIRESIEECMKKEF